MQQLAKFVEKPLTGFSAKLVHYGMLATGKHCHYKITAQSLCKLLHA